MSKISTGIRGAGYVVDFIPKIKIEVVVPDNISGNVVEVIETTGKTGKIGDGKLFAFSIEEAVRIRTGQRGEEAVWLAFQPVFPLS